MIVIHKMMGIICNVKSDRRTSMRVSREEKDRTYERIVASAARLFRARGLDGASVADVMHDAGLTHGGFYRHFPSKDALHEAALEASFHEIFALLDVEEAAPDLFQAYYLSKKHIDHPERGCPAAALASDVSRQPASLKRAFGMGIRRMIDRLATGSTAPETARRTEATRRLATMVGAAMIARASDPVTAKAVLAACRGTDDSPTNNR